MMKPKSSRKKGTAVVLATALAVGSFGLSVYAGIGQRSGTGLIAQSDQSPVLTAERAAEQAQVPASDRAAVR